MTTTFIGQPVSRVDGRAKVTGRATYAAEFEVRARRTPPSCELRWRTVVSLPSTSCVGGTGARRRDRPDAPQRAQAALWPAQGHLVDPKIGERLRASRTTG